MEIKKLEAVTVCVDYSDFLAVTLPHNLKHFDNYVVVTSYEDRETQDLCHHYGVECRTTNLMYIKSQMEHHKFAKGRAIDFGLAYLGRTDWTLQLDADTWLPDNTRAWLNFANLDSECIYGIDRYSCDSYEDWEKFQHQRYTQHLRHCLVIPPPFPMGARIAIKEYNGYIPIGFFQLWNAKKFPQRRYPLNNSGAEHTDVLHSLQWPDDKRRLLPELLCIHLSSETSSKMGANWHGRTTKQFGPFNPFWIREGLKSPMQAKTKSIAVPDATPGADPDVNIDINAYFYGNSIYYQNV